MKSQRNKTIDFPLSQADEYLKNCIDVEAVSVIPENSVVVGDAFKAL